MRNGLAALAITLTCLAFLLLLGVRPQPASSGQTPTPFPVVTPTPTPTPASPALIHWCKAMRRRAVRDTGRLAFADRCMGRKAPASVSALLGPSASQEQWQAAGTAWERQAGRFRVTLAARVAKMRHPGGAASGAKWLPLAAWVGWPRSTWHTLAALIWNESSGIPWEPNQQGSGCTGLLQLAPCWWAGKFDPRDPEANLREGLKIWRSQHGSFLPAWRGDPAVGW